MSAEVREEMERHFGPLTEVVAEGAVVEAMAEGAVDGTERTVERSVERTVERSVEQTVEERVEKMPEERVREYFERLKRGREVAPNVLDVTIQRFRRRFDIGNEEAERCLDYLIDHELIIHFSCERNYFKWSEYSARGRMTWLVRLLECAAGAIMMRKSVQVCCGPLTAKKKGRSGKGDDPEGMMAAAGDGTHGTPASLSSSPWLDGQGDTLLEWTDPITGYRYYLDPYENTPMRIPPDAPQRPSAKAVWNGVRREWRG